MFKNLTHIKNRLVQQSQPLFKNAVPRRAFSYRQGPNPSGGYGYGAMFGIGLGTAGLMYLVYHSRQLTNQRLQNLHGMQQMNFFHPTVQQRISKSLGYFGGGLAATGLMVGALRNSRLAYMNPWGLLFLTFGTLMGTMMTRYENTVLKHSMWAAFLGTMALSMVPLINMASMPVIFDALMATGFTMGGLGIVAYNAPSEEFLKWGGCLGMACAGMIGISLMSMFYPSPALFNLWLYGGLVLFGAFTLYDIQQLIWKAKTMPKWDPINESLGIYLDAINLFQHFLIIFMGNKKK